jgi:hypothetical protein
LEDTPVKRLPEHRADARPIEEKALGLIFAMDDDAAKRLHEMLRHMASRDSKRARMFVGSAQ